MTRVHKTMRALAAVFGCGICLGCANAVESDEPQPRLLAADEPLQGKTPAKWAADYVRWYYRPTDCDAIPMFDDDGSVCDAYQDPADDLFFLAPAAPSVMEPRVVRRNCRVPLGRALGVPVAMFFNDNAGVMPPLSDDELREEVVATKASMRRLLLRVDSIEQDVASLALDLITLEYDVPAAPNWYTCQGADVADTTVSPVYAAGYFAVIAPLPPGDHVVEFGGMLTFRQTDYAFQVEETIVVPKEH